MLKKIFLVTGLITLIVLNVIIWMGTGIKSLGINHINEIFNLLIIIMDITLFTSSIYFLWYSFKHKKYIFATLFSTILLLFVAAFIIRLTDIMGINVTWLFAFDIFALNVYLLFLSRNWENLRDITTNI